MRLHVGTSGFAYKEWKGSFYPKDLSAEKMLAFYSSRFNAVEINNTFYRFPRRELLQGWAAQAPAGFTFVLKAPQRITHIRRLKEVSEPVAEFFRLAGELGGHLGPALFQLPPNMKKDTARLRDLFASLPPGARAAMEFRHESWFDEEVFALMKEQGVALCLAEAEEGVETPFVSTAGWGYVRLRKQDYAPAELAQWVERMRAAGWSDVFVFFKHEDEGRGPKLAERFLALAG